MYVQIKAVRQSVSKTQKDFGESLGVSRDTLASYESGRVVPSNTFAQLLCATYSVNEEWLRTGDGEMFVESDETIIDEVAAQYGLGVIDKQMLKIFLELPDEKRERFKRFAFDLVDAVLTNDLLRTEFQNQYMDSDTLLFVNDGGAEAAKISEPAETGANEIKVFRAASSETDEKPEILNENRDRISALKAAAKVTSDEEL